MNQPTDRLGQPLSVGDWVEFNDHAMPNNKHNGIRLQIAGFEENHAPWHGPFAVFSDSTVAILEDLTKINPKPETTTWDKCVFVPEGVTP